MIHIALVPGVTVGVAPGRVSLSTSRGVVERSGLPAELVAALGLLAAGRRPVEELEQRVFDEAHALGLAQWMAVVRWLESEGTVAYELLSQERVIARLIPGRPGFALEPDANVTVRLSRFAFVKREGDQFVLDAPLAPGPIQLVDPETIQIVGALACARLPQDLAAAFPQPWVPPFLALLQGAGVLTRVAADGSSLEDRDRDAALWEFHDLLLHTSARSTRRDRRVSPTYRFKGAFDPLPALAAPRGGALVPLARPDTSLDIPFDDVLEARRSIRRHGPEPLTAQHLGEFLWRVAGVREQRVDASLGSAPYEILPRILPSGGACYPLEIYPVIGRCAGLDAAVYRYAPAEHALEIVSSDPRAVSDLLDSASWVMQDAAQPHMLFIITARPGRVSWKYEGSAYATVLKDVGVLYEAMYLVATAMQIAPCAVGAGSTATAERILGLEPLHESPVGEFIIGPAPR